MNTIGLQQQSDGTFIEVNLIKRFKFTPSTANRWYRIISTNNIISGEIKIYANHPNRKTEIVLNVNATTTSRPHISQISYTVIGGESFDNVGAATSGGHVNWARVARNQEGQLVFDILCIHANEEITIEGIGDLIPSFIEQPQIIGTDNQEYSGITGSDGESLANSLRLGPGVRSNLELSHFHGHQADPDTPLRVSGRVGYLHSLSLRGGAGKFTSFTDHFHLFFLGGVNAGPARWTPQFYTTWGSFNNSNVNKWNTWQIQNGNTASPWGPQNNELFAGGVTEFGFGENEVEGSLKYGIDTRRIDETGTGNHTDPTNPNTNPGPPLYDGEVDFYFTNTFTISNNTFVTVTFPNGIAGISAAILAGRTVGSVTGPLTAPDGSTNKYLLTIKLEGFIAGEWDPKFQAFATTPSNWQIKTGTAPITNQVGLSAHPTRRDKIIVGYSQPHNLTLGQNVVVNFLQQCFIVTTPARTNGVVTNVVDSNTVEILLGTCRRIENIIGVGIFPFFHNAGEIIKSNDSFSSDLYWYNGVPRDYITEGGNPVLRVKLYSSGQLPTNLEGGRDYWTRLNSNYPHYFLKLYNTQSDATNNVNPVQVQWKPAYGTSYMEFQDIQPLGPTGWAVYIGNTDPVHQQTFADAGWHMHRNLFPDNKGISQGVISQGVYGGLNEVQWYRQKAFAYGWNCSAENDDVVAIGLNIKNNTPKSIELGSNNNFKLRIEENKISTVGTGTVVVSALSATDISFKDLKVSTHNLSSNGVDTFLKIQQNDGTMYGLKLQLI